MKKALQVILVLSLAGLVFSGTLTYREVFAGAAKCPSPGAPGTILGYPACVYGFFMYLAIVVTTISGLVASARAERKAATFVAHGVQIDHGHRQGKLRPLL
jgi:uncharacterized membrane protein